MLMAIAVLPQQFHEAFENVLEIVGKGDNMPIAGLIPIITFFTWKVQKFHNAINFTRKNLGTVELIVEARIRVTNMGF